MRSTYEYLKDDYKRFFIAYLDKKKKAFELE